MATPHVDAADRHEHERVAVALLIHKNHSHFAHHPLSPRPHTAAIWRIGFCLVRR